MIRAEGNLNKARSIIGAVTSEAIRCGISRARHRTYGDLGVIYTMEDMFREAMEAERAALAFVRSSADRLQALDDLGISLLVAGAYGQAKIALESVTRARTDIRIRMNAAIELIDLEFSIGDRTAFERRRVRTQRSYDRMPPA